MENNPPPNMYHEIRTSPPPTVNGLQKLSHSLYLMLETNYVYRIETNMVKTEYNIHILIFLCLSELDRNVYVASLQIQSAFIFKSFDQLLFTLSFSLIYLLHRSN